ncbi:DUF6455 family protein [Paracoccaceae bacterium Fryx2]|nr:DUF6455 family protein [Paracoccaceae bacterium Fryx2]
MVEHRKPAEFDPLLLVSGMTRALALDLPAALDKGHLAPANVSHIHRRCADCSDPDACKTLLALEQGLEAPPHYCSNRRFLTFLRFHLPKG